MTQKQLADVMNIPKRTLQNWENRTSKCPEYTLGFINERADKYFLKNKMRLLKTILITNK